MPVCMATEMIQKTIPLPNVSGHWEKVELDWSELVALNLAIQ